MLALLLVMGLLGGQATPPPAQADQSRAEAIARARAGDYRAALETFQAIVAADPSDHDGRIWIARLQGWMGRPDEAEATYRAVLRENDRHVEAMVGLGSTLVNVGRRGAAFEVLEAAERLAPASPDVLAALARAHRLAGASSVALGYIERAVALAPTDENLMAREQIRLAHGHRIDVSGFRENAGTVIPDAHQADVSVTLRLRDRLRMSARGQVQRKFAIREQRAGAGIEWRAAPALALAASFMAGPDNTVLPQLDATVDATYSTGRAEWAAGYRYIEFATARVSVFIPGVTLAAGNTVILTARYYLALTDFGSGLPVQRNHSGLLRAAYTVRRRVWLSAGYARGTESFDTLSPDRTGAFSADTASGGLRLDLPGLTSLSAVYEHQRRSNDTRMRRLTLGIVQRF